MNFAIDFGTCNSVISYTNDNKICHILDQDTGNSLIPSVIFFIKTEITPKMKITDLIVDKHFIIGNSAKNMSDTTRNYSSYFYQFKRFLGITNKSINAHKDFLNKFNIKYETDDDIIYFFIPTCEEEEYIKINIIDLISIFFNGLINLIKISTNIIGNIETVITCPAYFHDLQRTQLKKAVENVNFKICKIFNEPTAAAIYYINKCNEIDSNNNKFIVYDLGGGTIDTTVVEYHIENKTCEIIDIDGNSFLGGVDIDNILINDIYYKYNIDKKNTKYAIKIKQCAEEIKIKLSYSTNVEIFLENVPIIKQDNLIYNDLKIVYSRHMFNNLINSLIDKMIESIVKLYNKYSTKNIILIGGPTQIPLLQNKINTLLGINYNQIILNQSTDLYKTIVADGANLLFEILKCKTDFCLLDVVPMDIGIASPEGKMITMINKHSKIPTSVERVFSTSYDCQRSIDVVVYEGISELCDENNYIGSYKIIGIPPLPRGSIIIKLLFNITINGILNASINGFKNSSDENNNSFDYKMTQNIKLIPNTIAKELFKKILLEKINLNK